MNYHALLFCPDEKTARVVTQVLTELEFKVENCSEPFGAVKLLMSRQFDAIVVDCDNEQNSALLFKSARNSTSNQSSLAVAVVEGQAGVAKAFRIGANLVLTKPINVEQSKGTLRVARGLLRKAESGKTVSSTYPVPKPAGHPPSLHQPIALAASATGGPSPRVKSGFAPFIAEIPNISAAAIAAPTNSSFDIQEDPVAGPDPTEAAFLESIPPTKPAMHFEKIAATKESPWRQISKPLGEKAQTRETGTTGKAPSSAVTTPSTPARRPFSTAPLSGAAVAPAKESRPTPQPATIKRSPSSLEMEVDAEDLDSLPRSATDETPILTHAQSEVKRSRMPIIAALAVITLAAAGYFAWDKIHGNVLTQAPPTSTPVQVQAPPTATPEAPASASAQPNADANSAQLAPPQIEILPEQTQSSSVSATDVAKSVKPPRVTSGQDSDNSSDVVVKSFPPKHASTASVAPSDTEETIAPPSLHASANTNDQTIAGLVAPATMPVLNHSSEVLKVSQGITEGMLLKKVAPSYPAQAIQMRKQGSVVLIANIGKSGSITSAKVLHGDGLLSQAALAAVKQWKYKPYLLNGQPIEVQTQISVNFKLP